MTEREPEFEDRFEVKWGRDLRFSAVDSAEPSQDLAHIASNGNRPVLTDAFKAFAELPDEIRMRRLAYLAEATAHVEAMAGPAPVVAPSAPAP